MVTELLPDRSKALAVTAPWSVEFDKDVLGVVEDDLVVLGADNNLDRAVVLLGNLSGLERGLEGASGELGDPVVDGSEGRNNTRHGELGATLDVLDDESGPVVHLEVEGLGVVSVLDSVDPDKVDLALVLLGNGLDGVNVFLELLIIGVDEHVGERKTGLGVGWVVLAGNLVEESDRVVEDELLEDLDVGVLDAVDGEVGATVVELLVDNDGWGLNASDLGSLLVGGDTEEVVVTVLVSDGGESRSRSIGLGAKIGNNDDLVGGLEFFVVGGSDVANSGERLPRRGVECLVRNQCFRARKLFTRLLEHVGNNAISLAWASIGGGLAAPEDFQGPVLKTWSALLETRNEHPKRDNSRVASDTLRAAEVCLVNAIDLGEWDALLLQSGGSFLVLGSKGLAVSAPGGER